MDVPIFLTESWQFVATKLTLQMATHLLGESPLPRPLTKVNHSGVQSSGSFFEFWILPKTTSPRTDPGFQSTFATSVNRCTRCQPICYVSRHSEKTWGVRRMDGVFWTGRISTNNQQPTTTSSTTSHQPPATTTTTRKISLVLLNLDCSQDAGQNQLIN